MGDLMQETKSVINFPEEGGKFGISLPEFPELYQDLKRIALSQMRKESAHHTLQPTALVNEAYMRMCAQRQQSFSSRTHFFGMAAHLMRRILVDHARLRRAQKRGAGKRPLSLNDPLVLEPACTEQDEALLTLEAALSRLGEMHPRQAKVVELRYFAGLSVEEAAAFLEISVGTAKRDWTVAKAWLSKELSSSERVE
jgi:RNA polymerase sigma-70 factor, ECF subfamily